MLLRGSKMADDEPDSDSMSEAATAVIVTNLSLEFFDDESMKGDFESAFRNFDDAVTFNYLKSFHRARVNFSSTEATIAARLQFHNAELCGQRIKCYFARVPVTVNEEGLLPPKPEKMFLISPPCSPPVGWEQTPESQPVINIDLIEALSRLSPDVDEPILPEPSVLGESHELHPATESMPGIVVHLCEDPEGYADRPTIVQTRRPQRN